MPARGCARVPRRNRGRQGEKAMDDADHRADRRLVKAVWQTAGKSPPVRVRDPAPVMPDHEHPARSTLCGPRATPRSLTLTERRVKSAEVGPECLAAKRFGIALPEDMPIKDLVSAAYKRWRIERDCQDLKQDFGLGHYKGRGWRGFHHHASLSIAAYAFVMSERLIADKPVGGKKLHRTPSACLSQRLHPQGQPCAHSDT
jgi:hypothetical protein